MALIDVSLNTRTSQMQPRHAPTLSAHPILAHLHSAPWFGIKFLHFVIRIHIQKPCKLHNLSKGTKLIDLFADSQSLYNQNHSFQNRAQVINADSCKTYRHDGSIKILLLEFVLERIDILIPIAVLRSVMNPGVGKEREASRPF